MELSMLCYILIKLFNEVVIHYLIILIVGRAILITVVKSS